jgi:hypothetical protein
MEFLQQNMMWVALAVVSGGMLMWPLIAGGTVAHLTPAEATLMMNREDAVVLDVRETGEWSSGPYRRCAPHHAGQLDKRLSELEKFKDTAHHHLLRLGQSRHRPAGKSEEGRLRESVQPRGRGFRLAGDANLPLTTKS